MFCFPNLRQVQGRPSDGRKVYKKGKKVSKVCYPLYVESDQANLPMIILRDILYRCDMS